MSLQLTLDNATCIPFHSLKRGQTILTRTLSKRQLQMRVVAANHYYRRRRFTGHYFNSGLSVIEREA